MTSSLGDWLDQSQKRLQNREAPLEIRLLEAQVLAAFVLEKPRAWVIAHPEQPLSEGQLAQLDRLLDRLLQGEPLPYLTGRQEFYGLSFEVNPGVLIPRPETELLVEEALRWLAIHRKQRRVADVGTGSGIIAVTIATQVPDIDLLAVDRSFPALELARRNAARHGVDHLIHWLQADLLTPVEDRFDLVCANLPYIPDDLLAELAVGRYEPRQALAGGKDGLDCIRALLEDAHRWLAPGGLLLLEIEASQGPAVLALGQQTFPSGSVSMQRDLAGLDRLVKIERGE